MSETLDKVLSDAQDEIPILKRRGGVAIAEALEEFVTRVSDASKPFRTFITERDAIVRSNHAVGWFRGRFPEWERLGLARRNPHNPRERTYLLCVVPVAARLSSARADAVRAAREG